MTLARLIAAFHAGYRVGAINLTRDSWQAVRAELLERGGLPATDDAVHTGPLHVGNVLGHPVHLSDRDSLSVWNGSSDSEVAIP